MKHYKKLIIILLVVVCLIAFASILKPEFISNSNFSYIFESQNLNTILLLADIILTICLFFCQESEQTNSTLMEFQATTATFNPGVDSYASISPSVYQMIQSNDCAFAQPYYCIQVLQEPVARHALFIPFEATIRTKVDGTNIKLSNLKIGRLDEQENMEILPLPHSFSQVFLNIEKMYQAGTKIYLCFSFFLGESTYSAFQDKIIIIKFDECFTNIRGKKIRREVQLKIYNSEYGLQLQGQS